MRTNFQKLDDGSWGVKVQGLPNEVARVTPGTELTIEKRNGGTSTVTVDRIEMTWNGGRVRVFRIARKERQMRLVESDGVYRGATATESKVTVTEPGVYETPEGTIYVVKPTRDKARLYAKRLVEIDAERATEAGERVQIEFEYAKGAIYGLTPEMKMPLERAKQLTIRYGRCIVCNTKLKAAQSVERGIGPVCIKSFKAAA